MVFGGIILLKMYAVTCMMHSLKANNKLINGKSKREYRMEGAWGNQAWGLFLKVQPLRYSSPVYFFVGQFKLN